MKFMKTSFIGLLIISLSLAQQDDIIVGNQEFTADLFKEVLKTKPRENIIFSPFTVQTVMALLTSATRANSPAIREIISGVKLPSKAKIDRTFKEITDELIKSNDDFKYFSANKIYFDSGCVVQKWFNDSAHDNYKADMEIIDFKKKNDAALEINSWVAKKTNNSIQNFVDTNDIPENTRIFLLNALYLSGKWNIPFETDKTTKNNFYSPSGTKQVDMMHIERKSFEYYEDRDAQYLKMELVREDGGAEVVLVLPVQRNGLDNLLENKLEAVLSHNRFGYNKVDVSLPKFKIRNNLSFKPMLQNLGVKQIFKGVVLEGYRYEHFMFNVISTVFQKAFIEVDESGIVAISATAVDSLVDAGLHTTHKVFNADHPFLFYIRVADVIVYAGCLLEP